MDKRSAETQAKKLLKECGFEGWVPVPLPQIARDLNIQVVVRPDLDSIDEGSVSAVLHRKGDTTVCLLNGRQTKTRMRFSLAHEIGHFVLHPRETSHVDISLRSALSSTGEDDKEIEANAFAAELLMPRDEVRSRVPTPLDPSLEDEKARISAVAHEFGVSDLAMRFRLLRLKLLSVDPVGLEL